jgi:hypothetical protein
MKKIIALVLFLSLLVFGGVQAQGGLNSTNTQGQQGVHEPGTGLEDDSSGQGAQQGANTTNTQGQQGVHEPGTGLEDDSSGQGAQQEGADQGQGESRRSKVANSVQAMLQIAERNEGVGEQIRVVAQNQNQIQEEAEDSLNSAQQRRGFMKFLIGPDYGALNQTKEKLQKYEENINELEDLKENIENDEDRNLLENEIQTLKDAKQEIEEDVEEASSGFSLFGWMNRIFNR